MEIDKAKEMGELKSKINRIEFGLKQFKQEYARLKEAVIEEMAAAGLKNLKLILDNDAKCLVSLSRKVGAKMEDEGQFRAWCAEQGLDCEAYRSWRKKDLDDFMREHLDGDDTKLPDGLEGWESISLSVRF